MQKRSPHRGIVVGAGQSTMDSGHQTANPAGAQSLEPGAAATLATASQQQLLMEQQPQQQQLTQQQEQLTQQRHAALADLLKRYEDEAQALGFPIQSAFHDSLQHALQDSLVPTGGVSGASQNLQQGTGSQQFEKVVGDIPVEKFPYGTPNADWGQWSVRFERAVQVATNAHGQSRLEELYLLWISLKLSDEAQPIYARCEHKDTNWLLLKAELAEALEDPLFRRKWARYKDAYKKPHDMSLQVYQAKITSLVNKYSPALATDPSSYSMELYIRFVNGLEPDWREYIEESTPYGKETLDNAYCQALKYEAKLAKKLARPCGAAAALSFARKDSLEQMQLDLERMKIQREADLDSNSNSESDSDSEEEDKSKGACRS